MARATYGSLITKLRGSILGFTFQNNSSGSIVRARPLMRKSQFNNLSNQNTLFKYGCTVWNGLSTANRNTWISFAANYTHTNYYDEDTTLTAFNWFMSINSNLYAIGAPLTITAPSYTLPASCPSFTASVSSHGIVLTPVTPYALGSDALYIFSTPRISSNFLKQRSKFRYTAQMSSGTCYGIDILSDWQTVHGQTIPSAGSAAIFNVSFLLIHIEKTTGLTSVGSFCLGSFDPAIVGGIGYMAIDVNFIVS